jgi:vacuolar-type H+-ATPase subunit I/STV1
VSIARDITGAAIANSNQSFEIMALVSNPDAFVKRIKELQALIDKNKEYVELAGKVSEITRLRDEAGKLHEQTDALNKAARAKAEEAEKAAAEALKNAQTEAAAIVAAAKEAADKVSGEAKAATKKANDLAKKSTDRAAALDAREAELGKLTAILEEKNSKLSQALADAEVAKEIAVKTKNEIIAKHKALIEGL